MYVPASFAETNRQLATDLIAKYPLGVLFTAGSSGLFSSTIPFQFRINDNNKQFLVAHLARANPHWKDLDNLEECLVVFSGAHNYVTPDWYPTKKITHKVVPTWNYETVQVRGKPRIIESGDWIAQQVSELTNVNERNRLNPWKVSDAPADFIENQLKAIIGLEIEITDIKGKWKMSQNRPIDDINGVVEGLSNSSDLHSNQEVANIVLARNAIKNKT